MYHLNSLLHPSAKSKLTETPETAFLGLHGSVKRNTAETWSDKGLYSVEPCGHIQDILHRGYKQMASLHSLCAPM